MDFVKKVNLLSYTSTSCLRNDYAHNECDNCMVICPENVLVMERGKYTIKEGCTSCAACLGSCPTEALVLETFDPNSFVLELTSKEDKAVSCKKDASCLGAFDIAHYMTMALKNETEVTCDLSHCATCEMNKENALFEDIEGKIDLANIYLDSFGIEKKIAKNMEAEETKQSRFAMFKKAHSTVTNSGKEGATDIFAQSGSKIPLKNLMLKNALRENMQAISNPKMKINPIFASQEISFDKCTNCHECVMFCPTDALFGTDDKQGVMFNGGNCIACGICHEVCVEDAIHTPKEFDIVPIIYDRVEELVRYEMAQCLECNCAYPYKGGEQICHRCKEFVEERGDMFTFAKDMK